jgi:aspartyl-tRNA(Asn)/glutamyl-tRNA(Gln) amidotransferase subunit A
MHTRSLLDEARLVRSGEVRAIEVVTAALERIERLDGELGAFCEVDGEAALAQAEAVDARVARHEDPGPLAGVPIGVKDLEDAAGLRTTYGDPKHAEDPPAARDSVHVARYRAAGAVIVGKTNTPAYGFHAETDNLLFGPTRSPVAPTRTAGGSSGGSAAAVAAGMVTLCTGSDGGGSIRIPSLACGLAGFKPTHGVVPSGDETAPTWGPFSSRGPMARTFAEIAYALDVVRGFSSRDLLSLELAGSFVDAAARGSVAGLRIAWAPALGSGEVDPQVLSVCRAALDALAGAGAIVEETATVFSQEPAASWLPLAAAGSWRRIGADEAEWPERFLPDATALAGVGRHVDAAQLLEAEAGMHRAGLDLAAIFDRFDLLACPGHAGPPPRVREPSPYGPGWAGQMTLPFNVTRSPAAVVPAGTMVDGDDVLPVALQLAAPRCGDLVLMGACAAAEEILAR